VPPLRQKLATRAQALLEPGERVERAFLAQAGPNPNLLLVTNIFVFFNKYKVIAVTDRAIVVFSAGMWRPSFPKKVLARLPRETRLGDPAGALWSKINLPSETKATWVHRRFYNDVRATDAVAGGASGSPQVTA